MFLVSCNSNENKRIRIAAAADLRLALDSIKFDFEKLHPEMVCEITFGSAGKLTQQILNGAPFDLFFSADEKYPQKIYEKNLAKEMPQFYAFGTLVLWSRLPELKMEGIDFLLNPKVKKIAIANPDHAPYGQRAKEFLEKMGWFDTLQSKLVFAENISQASQFAESGAADVGFLSLSLVLGKEMKKNGADFIVIDSAMYSPLRQKMLVLKNENEQNASLFKDFFFSEQGRNTLKNFGFKIP